MNFDFSDDQKLLRRSARDFLAERCPLARVRAILESEAPLDRDLWRAASDMGWPGRAVPEAEGGTGSGYLELAVLAEEVGRALAPVPFSSSVYLAMEALRLAGTAEQRAHHLPRLVAGQAIGTLAASEGAGQAGVEIRFVRGRLSGRKAPVPDGDAADLAVVTARTGDGRPTLALVDLTGPGVRREPLRSFDPRHRLIDRLEAREGVPSGG